MTSKLLALINVSAVNICDVSWYLLIKRRSCESEKRWAFAFLQKNWAPKIKPGLPAHGNSNKCTFYHCHIKTVEGDREMELKIRAHLGFAAVDMACHAYLECQFCKCRNYFTRQVIYSEFIHEFYVNWHASRIPLCHLQKPRMKWGQARKLDRTFYGLFQDYIFNYLAIIYYVLQQLFNSMSSFVQIESQPPFCHVILSNCTQNV